MTQADRHAVQQQAKLFDRLDPDAAAELLPFLQGLARYQGVPEAWIASGKLTSVGSKMLAYMRRAPADQATRAIKVSTFATSMGVEPSYIDEGLKPLWSLLHEEVLECTQPLHQLIPGNAIHPLLRVVGDTFANERAAVTAAVLATLKTENPHIADYYKALRGFSPVEHKHFVTAVRLLLDVPNTLPADAPLRAAKLVKDHRFYSLKNVADWATHVVSMLPAASVGARLFLMEAHFNGDMVYEDRRPKSWDAIEPSRPALIKASRERGAELAPPFDTSAAFALEPDDFRPFLRKTLCSLRSPHGRLLAEFTQEDAKAAADPWYFEEHLAHLILAAELPSMYFAWRPSYTLSPFAFRKPDFDLAISVTGIIRESGLKPIDWQWTFRQLDNHPAPRAQAILQQVSAYAYRAARYVPDFPAPLEEKERALADAIYAQIKDHPKPPPPSYGYYGYRQTSADKLMALVKHCRKEPEAPVY